MATRRKLPGFDATPHKMLKPFPAAYVETIKTVRPQAGDLNKDALITFQITPAPNECIKFSAEPFSCQYVTKIWDSGTNAWKMANVAPFDADTMPFLVDQTQAGSVFFNDIEVLLDNKPCKIGNVGSQAPFINNFNKSMMSQDTFRKTYGRTLHRIRCSLDHFVLKTDVKPAAGATDEDKKLVEAANIQNRIRNRSNVRLNEAYEPLHMDAAKCTTFKHLPFGWEATFPFTSQLHVTRVFTGVHREVGFLPPGVGCQVRLFKRNPLTIGLERFDTSASDRVKGDHTNPEVKFQVELKDLVLTYVSMTLKNEEEVSRIRRSENLFYQDRLTTQIHSLSPQVKFENLMVDIPKNCLGVILIFMHQSLLFPDKDRFQTMSARRIFPTNLKSMNFEISGRPGLLASHGLSDVTKSKAQSLSLYRYYADLVSQGLYDEPYHIFAPSTLMSSTSYDDSVVLNLSKYQMDRPETLLVSLTYDDDLACTGWHMSSFAITEAEIRWKASSGWEWKE